MSAVQGWQEIGGLVGRFVLAWLAMRIVSRRKLLRVFQVPGLILLPLVFFFPAHLTTSSCSSGASSCAGLLTVAQFSFWGNYLPRVYPTHLRGTGESFAANVGGRMIGTSAALAHDLAGHRPAGRHAQPQARLRGRPRGLRHLRHRPGRELRAARTRRARTLPE